jgi:Cof subfamily protein (haloacid dehalogenase superfamily)
MIKLIVTDVDGTLLDNNSEIPELNRKAIIDCKKRNIEIILATGKSIASILPIIKLFDLKLPQITLGGAVVVDKDLQVINTVKIDPKYYFEVVREIKAKGYIPLIAIPDGKIFYDEYDPNFIIFNKINEQIFKTDRLEKDEFAKNCVCLSVAIRETDPLDSYLRNKYSKELQIVRSGELFFDLLNPNASKGNALHFISKIYGFKPYEIVVFGDSYNDLSMFEYAGLKIAVKNSYPEVLKKADYITDENYNAGLGKAIYKFVLK